MSKLAMRRIIEQIAKKLHTQYEISDNLDKRLRKLIKGMIFEAYEEKYNEDTHTMDDEFKGYQFDPIFDYFEQALSFIENPEIVIGVFERDRDKICKYAFLWESLMGYASPILTLSGLAENLKKFVDYLNANKTDLLKTGYPKEYYFRSFWLFARASRLWPIKVPARLYRDYHKEITEYRPWLTHQEIMELVNDDVIKKRNGAPQFEYTWVRETPKEKIFPDNSNGHNCYRYCEVNSYDEAPYIPTLTSEEISLIEGKREKLFELKVKVLILLSKHILIANENFWVDIFGLILDSFSVEEITQFYEIEVKIKENVHGDLVADTFLDMPNQALGSFIDLLILAEYVYKECMLRTCDSIITKLRGFLDIDYSTIRGYIDLVNHCSLHQINVFLDKYYELKMIESGYWLTVGDWLGQLLTSFSSTERFSKSLIKNITPDIVALAKVIGNIGHQNGRSPEELADRISEALSKDGLIKPFKDEKGEILFEPLRDDFTVLAFRLSINDKLQEYKVSRKMGKIIKFLYHRHLSGTNEKGIHRKEIVEMCGFSSSGDNRTIAQTFNDIVYAKINKRVFPKMGDANKLIIRFEPGYFRLNLPTT